MQQNIPKLWIFVFLAVSAIILSILFTSPSTPESTMSKEPEMEPVRSATFEGMLEKGENAIYVENQASDQSYVLVGYVVLAQPGYVVVFDDNDGVPGKVIGTSELLDSGGEHLITSMNEPLVDGMVYYAMLYQDDGDGRFRLEKDRQVVDMEDNVILMTFLANQAFEPETGPINP